MKGEGEVWCWVCTWRPRRKEEKGGGEEGENRGEREARWKNKVHLTSARVCSSHATMPCCCVRSGGVGCRVHPCPCQCVATSCVASHAIITMMSCLCASVFSNQPSLSVCLSVCVCRGHASAGRRAHTQERRMSACVCEEEERETASQMNQPSEATSVCVCVKKKREKRERREKRVAEEEQKRE